jgi:hypothetical protein
MAVHIPVPSERGKGEVAVFDHIAVIDSFEKQFSVAFDIVEPDMIGGPDIVNGTGLALFEGAVTAEVGFEIVRIEFAEFLEGNVDLNGETVFETLHSRNSGGVP